MIGYLLWGLNVTGRRIKGIEVETEEDQGGIGGSRVRCNMFLGSNTTARREDEED